ncbi:MAG: hypothetical protein IPH48_04065 [bacterium]|nr:hypothetical protein [bacterium]
MSLHIPGALPTAAPATNRQEAPHPRPDLEPAAAPAVPTPRPPVGDPSTDQWLPQAAAPESPTYADPTAVQPNNLAAAPALPQAAPTGAGPADLAKVAAERVRQDALASPPQAARVHASLVPGTVLNLLA